MATRMSLCGTFCARLLIGITVLLCGTMLGSCKSSNSSKQRPREITVFCAGSLARPIQEVARRFERENPGVRVLIEPEGSRVCIRKWTELGRPVDLVAVADSYLIRQEAMPGHTDWCLEFTGNRMVIAFTERSRHAAEINRDNWYEILSRPGVTVGRSDENLDPCGYRTLMAMQLADLYYPSDKRCGRSVLESVSANISGNNIRPKGLDLQSLLQSKQLDYAFEYHSFAVQHNLLFVDLPDEINLGNPNFESQYAKAKVKVTGTQAGQMLEYTGAAITYGLTIPNDAPNREAAIAFTAFLLGPAGGEEFARLGMPFYERLIVHGKNIPGELSAKPVSRPAP